MKNFKLGLEFGVKIVRIAGYVTEKERKCPLLTTCKNQTYSNSEASLRGSLFI